MIITSLAIAGVLLCVVFLGTYEWTHINPTDLTLFVISLALGAGWAIYYERTYQDALAVAFLANCWLTLRLLLDVASDACKTAIVSRSRTRR